MKSEPEIFYGKVFDTDWTSLIEMRLFIPYVILHWLFFFLRNFSMSCQIQHKDAHFYYQFTLSTFYYPFIFIGSVLRIPFLFLSCGNLWFFFFGSDLLAFYQFHWSFETTKFFSVNFLFFISLFLFISLLFSSFSLLFLLIQLLKVETWFCWIL